MSFIDPNVFEDIISRPAAAAISDHLFAYITAGTIAVATAGGNIDGVTVSEVTAVGDEVSIFPEGAVPVKVGAAGVTADHDVMVASGGLVVDATFGFIAVGRAEETAASGAEARIRLYPRGAQNIYGSGLGAEKVVTLVLTGAAIHAGVQAKQITDAALISRVVLVTTTVATGAATLDIGTTATSATTPSDNLIDGLDVNAAAGVFDNTINHGTNGKAGQTLAANKWVTVKESSGDATGLVGTLYIYYVATA